MLPKQTDAFFKIGFGLYLNKSNNGKREKEEKNGWTDVLQISFFFFFFSPSNNMSIEVCQFGIQSELT